MTLTQAVLGSNATQASSAIKGPLCAKRICSLLLWYWLKYFSPISVNLPENAIVVRVYLCFSKHPFSNKNRIKRFCMFLHYFNSLWLIIVTKSNSRLVIILAIRNFMAVSSLVWACNNIYIYTYISQNLWTRTHQIVYYNTQMNSPCTDKWRHINKIHHHIINWGILYIFSGFKNLLDYMLRNMLLHFASVIRSV